MATTGDPYVLNTQKWLNKTYGDDSRFNTIIENGKTGWPTIYALTRALQIELGITTTADNFGPSTQSKFNSKYPSGIHQQADEDETEDNIYAIIQGALLCKGYSTGVNTPTLHFYNGTGNAIKKLKQDAGCNDSTSTVTLNVMKALLSMDYFVCIKAYGGDDNIRLMQQYMNKKYEKYIGLRPCDGIYNRSTSVALIYSLQAAEKMPTSVANGNLGPSTRRCCPTIPYDNQAKSYNNNTYQNADIIEFETLLNIALYVNGYGSGSFENTCNYPLISKFQHDYALPETGICDLTTWLSLLQSCGDINRSALACDCATILTQDKAKTLYDNGYRYVGRYLSGTIVGGASKALSIEELQLAFAQGLRIFPIHQGSANKVSYFTEENAEKDVISAVNHANSLKIPKDTIIYFAVDCDPQDGEITNYIIPYFNKIYNLMNDNYFNKYKIGIYGTRNVCSRVSDKGFAVSSFVSDMSTGFSGNLGFKMPDNWAFDQFATITIGSGTGQIEIDKDAYSGRDKGINYLETDEIYSIYLKLEKIYNVALSFKSGNVNESNILTTQYLRYLKGGEYGFPGITDDNGKYGIKWQTMAGIIDKDVCDLVDSKISNEDKNLTFNDPLTQYEYDILHFGATLNCLLHNVVHETLSGLDNIVDDYAGWAGDMLTFAENIKSNNLNQEQANKLICSDQDSKFNIADYNADLDAVNIADMIKGTSNLTLPKAFLNYFKNEDLSKPNYSSRTKYFISHYGSMNQFMKLCENIVQSEIFPYPTLRAIAMGRNINPDDYQSELDKAEVAFLVFVGKEYNNNR